MVKVGIIDDELHSIKSLTLDLQHLFPDFELVFKTTKPLEGLKLLAENKIDLLFLDVEMPGLSGLELLTQLEVIDFDVIFVTAYSHYAVEAFKAQAIHYLLKPIGEDDLKDALDNWLLKRAKQDGTEEIEALLDAFKKGGILHNKIALPISDGLEFVEVSKIMYCQSQSNYTTIFFEDNRELLISKTLKEVGVALQEFYFLRPSQSYLVNPNYMRKYVRNDGGFIVMVDDKKIPVSSKNKVLIVNIFKAVERKSQ